MNKAECHECGEPLRFSAGPGRLRTYRKGEGYEIPSDLVFQICASCKAEWMTSGQIDRLSAAFESERARRMTNDTSRASAASVVGAARSGVVVAYHGIVSWVNGASSTTTMEMA